MLRYRMCRPCFVLLLMKLKLAPTRANTTSITWYYTTFLERAPDSGGLAYWAAHAATDWLTQVSSMLYIMLTSAEYKALKSVSRVTEILTIALGRAPTSGEITAAQAKLAAGFSLNALSAQESSVTADGYVDEGTRLGWDLQSQDWDCPPPDLGRLVALPNGVLAAVKGRQVYFCEPYMPYAWPLKYIKTLTYDVVGAMAYEGQLLLTTTASPVVISGAHPGGMTDQYMKATEAGIRVFAEMAPCLDSSSRHGTMPTPSSSTLAAILNRPRTWCRAGEIPLRMTAASPPWNA